MKKRVLIALVVALALLAVGALAASATDVVTTYPVSVIGCAKDGTPQFCEIPQDIDVTTGGVLKVMYSTPPGHCSEIRVYIYVDGVQKYLSDFMGPCADTPLVDLGPVSPGSHTVSLRAEGRVGGCNTGWLYSWGGSAEVHTSTHVPVSIDIKPGSWPNSINLGSKGVIPVAIFSTPDFDATQVDPDTVALAGAGVALRGKGNKSLAREEDVNGDGLPDLMVQVETENLDPSAFQDGFATLTGQTFGGQDIQGSDEIVIVPPE